MVELKSDIYGGRIEPNQMIIELLHDFRANGSGSILLLVTHQAVRNNAVGFHLGEPGR